ncbi:MAG: sialidase family protein [Planctomycetaceae bacterium]
MTSIEVLASGRIDENDSAFPSTILLPDGTILCSYSETGGQYVHGGTGQSRSLDGGRTWSPTCVLCPANSVASESANYLKLTFDPASKRIYGYGACLIGSPNLDFGIARWSQFSPSLMTWENLVVPPELLPIP